MMQLDEPPVQEAPPTGISAATVSSWSGKAREDAVQRMFTAIARFYDLNNSVLSFGLHHRWKRLAASYVPSAENGRAVDIGAGTADLALLIEQRMGHHGHVIATDLNDAMLQEGARKVAGQGLTNRITCMRANAEHIALLESTVDAVTTGFCMRNVGNLSQALSEIRRVLKPGGRFVCLEFSQPIHPWLLKLYDWYSFRLLPRIGTLVARDKTGVYQYLPASIRTFPNQERLSQLLRETGFHQVDYRNLSGGIVAIHVATK
ncbi:MAG: class I SAM-dependent methyltransferase [Nitrospiraceae bacterium]